MGKTFKDRLQWERRNGQKRRGGVHRKKFPRVPLIQKRSEPFEDRRRKEDSEWLKEWDDEPTKDEIHEEEQCEADKYDYEEESW